MKKIGELTYEILANANIGLWAIELDKDEKPRMYADDTMLRLLGISEGLTPEEVYNAWYENIHIDAYAGFVVSLFVIKSGIDIFMNVLDTILGKVPDKELVKDIEKTILSHKKIHGIHDLMLHDYGNSQKFMTLHAEVDSKEDVIKLHDLIDNVERELLEKYNILTTIHMDPVDYKNKKIKILKSKVEKIVKSIDDNYSIHDFRVVVGPTHTNLVFDCLLPSADRSSHEVIQNKIQEEVFKIIGKNYFCVIQVEHSFVD